MQRTIYKLSFMALFLLGFAPQVSAVDQNLQNGADAAHSGSTPSNLFGSSGAFHVIADVLIYLVGALAVLMLIIGGLRYVASQGNADGTKQAKDTILYAVIGIVVAVLAFAVVSFITGSLT